jgi:hypothetical protein
MNKFGTSKERNCSRKDRAHRGSRTRSKYYCATGYGRSPYLDAGHSDYMPVSAYFNNLLTVGPTFAPSTCRHKHIQTPNSCIIRLNRTSSSRNSACMSASPSDRHNGSQHLPTSWRKILNMEGEGISARFTIPVAASEIFLT